MTSQYKFSQRSIQNLRGVHPALVAVVYVALSRSSVDFGITEGLRGAARQKQLVAQGKSQTQNSRHLTGHAVDVLAYPTPAGSWDWKWYEQIAKTVKAVAKELGVNVVWGGDWTSLKDGVHFEINPKEYPQ